MATDDKYPESSGRRRFVKGVVGSASLSAVGTATAVSINTATAAPGAGGGPTQFFGIENTAGPAPNAMPMIPVRIDDEGYLQGLFPEWEEVDVQGQIVQQARMDVGGIEYGAPWFQYCGVQTYPGLQPDADQDQYFRYASSSPYDWQDESVSVGDRMHIDDFEDYETWGNDIGDAGQGKPAMGTWRSQDVPPQGEIPVQVLRFPDDVMEQTRNSLDSATREWLDAASQENFVAWMNKCTHFCCVPTFKGTEQSLQYDAGNEVYCPCHQSVYDPNSPLQETFIALPRPEE